MMQTPTYRPTYKPPTSGPLSWVTLRVTWLKRYATWAQYQAALAGANIGAESPRHSNNEW
jgi:hypothetical protein